MGDDKLVTCQRCQQAITYIELDANRSRFLCGCGRGCTPSIRAEDLPALAQYMNTVLDDRPTTTVEVQL